ncbi:MAG TPA: bifunctional UDP-N-acetylglucosamine diphosphorylase/glucosamine-1-phosphate N-acetyltransferase GlmU [Verrucomicrobiae bacterium]|nr:bifunctional UDP-N-acetylglucosamine diphosphorylase/glucosamine-1-phosphate N-acetyltransferase GlmU [Verrucomicrobiae bacterium]
MTNNDVAILILAAGKGTRLKSSMAKVLHHAGGRALVEHVVRSCEPLGAKKTVVVIGYQAEKVAEVVAPYEVETVVQQPQKGTGHALVVAKRAIGNAKYVMVLPGDAPLVRMETLRALIHHHKKAEAAATILTAVLADPSGYGRILRKAGETVAAIIEESQLTAEQRELNEINSSIYCFTMAKLWPALAQVKPNNKHREIYLTDAIGVLNANGETVLAEIAPDARETLGCNTRAELSGVDRTLREWKRDELMNNGATIQLPETVLIDPDVSAGEDTVIEPCVQLLGKTKIGSRCTIKTGCVLLDAVLGDDVTIEPHSVITKSRIDSGVIAGPFARMRPDTHVKRGAKIGNFVELKKSVIGEGSKVPHLSYIGDTKIGTKSNIGAGTITCNYDGFAKYPTTIGNRVFIGSDSVLIAPVKIGDGAYVAASSAITDNVPADALGIARGKQVNKPGWASRKRRELAAGEGGKKSSKKGRKKARSRR